MFKRNWSIGLALGLILAGLGHGQEIKANQNAARDDSKAQLERIATAIEKHPIVEAPDPGCEPGRDDYHSDLCAQWKSAIAAAESARWDLWMMAVAAVGLLVGGGTLVAAWRAAHWAKSAAEHTEAGAKEAEKAADATIEAVAATRESNEISREFNERQLRAYVGVVDFRIRGLMEGHVPSFEAKYQNRGQTPAKNLVSRGFLMMTMADPNSIKFPLTHKEVKSNLNLMPDCDGWSYVDAGEPLSKINLTFLKQGFATFVFAGYIIYHDVFGVRRYTIFRYFLVPKSINDDGEGILGATARHNLVS